MFPPDDTLPAGRLTRWLDWWFARRGRALLTWVVLAGLGQAMVYDVFGYAGYEWLAAVVAWPVHWFNRVSPMPLSYAVELAVIGANLGLLGCWFEPCALRLNWTRGAAWLALRIVPDVVWPFLPSTGPILTWCTPVANLLGSLLMVLVLRGWRSRPWLGIVGTVLAIAAGKAMAMLLAPSPASELLEATGMPTVGFNEPPPTWVGTVVWVLPFAATLLYGTRLLHPEERARA